MTNFLVDSDKKLNNLFLKIKDYQEIGLDTEFIRESTYRPILALIQISLPDDDIYLIDPLSISDSDLINEILIDNNIVKIIHSSKQDLEALYAYTKEYPCNIFDTQIASNLLFEKSNMGYSTLVKNICDVDIKEGSWRTNWLKRPLSDEKKNYAADDVKYLINIKNELVKNLKKLNRYSWFEEEQDAELQKSNIIIKPVDAWEKVNYPLYFESENIELLKKTSLWRENLAIKYNIPKRWLLSDSQMIKIIVSNDNKTLEIINNIKHEITEYEKKDLNELLKSKKIIKNKNLPSTKNIEQKYNQLLSYVSDEYKIDSTIIANKRDIEIFSLTSNKTKFMSGWRYQIFGKLLQ